MTYKEFEELVTKLTYEIKTGWNEDSFDVDDGFIVQRHETGGAQGGNCWGGSAQYYTNTNPQLEFLPLDATLKEVAPNISYLKYKEIERLIEEDNDNSDYEYYGNYTDYDIRKLDIRKLYDMIFP